MINIDADPRNQDWTKRTWDLPPYKSEEFNRFLAAQEMSLEQFRKLPVYEFAIDKGLIKNDTWVGGE